MPQSEAKPLDQGETFSPPQPEDKEDNTKPEKKSKTILQIEEKWKDEYSRIGDAELEEIMNKANNLTDTYTFSNGLTKNYKPITNRLWKEMTRKRRQWQAIQNREDNSNKTIAELEDMISDYYSQMCKIYFDMSQDEYDDLPPAETQQAVEVCNHKTIHPLKAKPRSTDGSTQK